MYHIQKDNAKSAVWILAQKLNYMMTKISILHPSRGRPLKSINTCLKWIEKSCLVWDDIELVISNDNNDPSASEYVNNVVDTLCRVCEVSHIFKDNRSAVDAINRAAEVASGDIFIVVSDDTDCPENWGVDLLKFVEGKTDWIAKFPEGIQDWIITMPVMDRAYYNRFGYVYHPDYIHMFCDTELSCVADLTGRRITGSMVFPHRHYSTGAFAADEVSKKADATWVQGEELFLRRAKNKFDLTETPGVITNRAYILWARSKGVLL